MNVVLNFLFLQIYTADLTQFFFWNWFSYLLGHVLDVVLEWHHLTRHPKTRRWWEGRRALLRAPASLPLAMSERGRLSRGMATGPRQPHHMSPRGTWQSSSHSRKVRNRCISALAQVRTRGPGSDTTVRAAPPNQSSKNPQVMGGVGGPS
jgi:hypothetical protein